jgi:hypothetical protein
MVDGQFDPLGAAAPMTIKGKIRLRELVGDSDRESWSQYLHIMQQLRDVEFPRCLFEEEKHIFRSELQTFA